MLSDLLIVTAITLASVVVLVNSSVDWYHDLKGSIECTVSRIFTPLIAIVVGGDMFMVYTILSQIDLATMSL